jgi:hypothetical protein
MPPVRRQFLLQYEQFVLQHLETCGIFLMETNERTDGGFERD